MTSYDPWMQQDGEDQPILEDGTLTGSYTVDGGEGDIHIELTIGTDTAFIPGGALVLGLPNNTASINAAAVVTIGGVPVTWWAWLPGSGDNDRIMLTSTPAPPQSPGRDLLFMPEAAGFTPGDTIVIDGRLAWAPPECPSCAALTGEIHSTACTVALCREDGQHAQTCPHAGAWPRGMSLWQGVMPGVAEAAELGYADVDALIAAGATGDVVWNVTRERWELPEADITTADYGFAAAVSGDGRYEVMLGDEKIVRNLLKADAVTQLELFISQAQAALTDLEGLA